MTRRTLVETLPSTDDYDYDYAHLADILYFTMKASRARIKDEPVKHALEHFKACFARSGESK